MLFGAQVRSAGGLTRALDRGAAMGAEVIQVFTQNPRGWRPTPHRPEALAGFPAHGQAGGVVRTAYCHATYLVNLASPDPLVYERSSRCLVANLRVATAIGAAGLVLHPGSHRGAGLASALGPMTEGIHRAFEEVDDACPLLLENTAGGGGTIGRTFEELAVVLDAVGRGPARLGVCLDTQHLWASGTSFATLDEADAVVTALGQTVGLGPLACLHLNDSKVALGASRDRHENLGQGTIGSEALGILLGHPALQELPVILEVPGVGEGPARPDLRRARSIHRRGRARWAKG